MVRTKQSARGGRGRRPAAPARSRFQHHDPELLAAQKKAERREKILMDRRRVAAKWRAKIPDVHKVNFENFKNRFHDPERKDYAIEVLMSGPNHLAQVRREQALRRKEERARLRESFWLGYGGTPEKAAPTSLKRDAEERVRREKRAEATQANENEIQKIRIQSQPVLGHLTSLLNDTEQRSTPRTFVRPFKALVYFQPKMKEFLATLEEKWGDFEELDDDDSDKVNETPEEAEVVDLGALKARDSASASEEGDTKYADDDDDAKSMISVDSNAEDLDTIMDGVEALRDMRCYVDFVDKEVMPLYDLYQGTRSDKIKFEDLWCLFRPGDLIYMPSAGDATGRYHEVWRIYRTETPEPETSYPSYGWEFFSDELQQDKKDKFNIFAYYIDHDGNNFGAVRHKFELESFAGDRLIESLEVFPIRYRHDHQQLLASLEEQGHNFQRYLTDRHQAYNSWTLTRNPPFDTTDPNDEILVNNEGGKMRHPEFVESDVIVDLAEAYQYLPDWRPQFMTPTLSKSIRCSVQDDEMEIQQWLDGARQTLAYAQSEIVQKDDGVEIRQRRENMNSDTFLSQRLKGSRKYEMKPQLLDLRNEDLVLLPKRMFAYALRERRFVPVNINSLQPIRREQGVFESLKILQDYKDIVRGLVASHFSKKTLERRYVDMSTEGPSQDLIQGKGRGLVVLLHGVPGVGKTATAEAVAMENRKPLFVITCGDLGLTPADVEASLNNVFRLAHLWDCVLLLDEADVFLAQRSKLDMKRNALVSVFLRVLEYYNGLLFLTTNRVGTIDEAFKSRIHMSLYYPPLDKAQTRDIFRLNMAKLRLIEGERAAMTGEPTLQVEERGILEFAGQHYEDHARSTGCWNGRQIRNAFQVASSLAHYNYDAEVERARREGRQGPKAPTLNRTLFEKVQVSTQSFDKHMKESKGFDEDLPLRNTFYGGRDI